MIDRVLHSIRDGEQHWTDQDQGQEDVNAAGIHAEDVGNTYLDQKQEKAC